MVLAFGEGRLATGWWADSAQQFARHASLLPISAEWQSVAIADLVLEYGNVLA